VRVASGNDAPHLSWVHLLNLVGIASMRVRGGRRRRLATEAQNGSNSRKRFESCFLQRRVRASNPSIATKRSGALPSHALPACSLGKAYSWVQAMKFP